MSEPIYERDAKILVEFDHTLQEIDDEIRAAYEAKKVADAAFREAHARRNDLLSRIAQRTFQGSGTLGITDVPLLSVKGRME